jgi:hypothetical protein
VFRTSSVELVPTNIGVGDLDLDSSNFINFFVEKPVSMVTGDLSLSTSASGDQQLVLQPKTIPSIDDDFTFGGKCTTTNGKTLTQITSHSCFYDLCLGSPTDCVNIYAGGRFNLSPIKTERNRAYLVGLQNDGLLDPEEAVRKKKKFGYGRSLHTEDNTNIKKRRSAVVRGDITKNETPASNTRKDEAQPPQTNNSRNAAGSRKLQNQLKPSPKFPDKIFGSFDTEDVVENGRFPLPPNFPGYVRVVVLCCIIVVAVTSSPL